MVTLETMVVAASLVEKLRSPVTVRHPLPMAHSCLSSVGPYLAFMEEMKARYWARASSSAVVVCRNTSKASRAFSMGCGGARPRLSWKKVMSTCWMKAV